jgi:hypothetical protein
MKCGGIYRKILNVDFFFSIFLYFFQFFLNLKYVATFSNLLGFNGFLGWVCPGIGGGFI